MAASAREARRRRILERGSVRLDLITGKIQSLPSSSAFPPLFDESMDSSSQPLISDQRDLWPFVSDQPAGIYRVSDQPAVSPKKYKLVGSTLHHKDPEISARSTAYDATTMPPLFNKSNEIEPAVASTPENGGRAPSHFAPSEDQGSSPSTLGRDQYSKPKPPSVRSFSLNELSSAISESEKTRLCVSAIIAFLVVASYVGFPFFGQCLMRNVFGSRPLYLLLLTNVTVVLGRLLFTKQKGSRVRVSNRGEGQVRPAEQSSVEQIGKVLEAGLVAQKAMGAIFMDCSVFAVIVVSGLSIVHHL